jgi:hypothetical protein
MNHTATLGTSETKDDSKKKKEKEEKGNRRGVENKKKNDKIDTSAQDIPCLSLQTTRNRSASIQY